MGIVTICELKNIFEILVYSNIQNKTKNQTIVLYKICCWKLCINRSYFIFFLFALCSSVFDSLQFFLSSTLCTLYALWPGIHTNIFIQLVAVFSAEWVSVFVPPYIFSLCFIFRLCIALKFISALNNNISGSTLCTMHMHVRSYV